LLDGYHHAVAACARQGLNILVDEVAFDEECVRGWGDALRGLPVTWIAVRCDADVAEARELARGDRVPGLARRQSEVVHRWARYDGEVDTTETPLDLVAAQLDAILTSEIRQ
jgi:chloramphenicol 3-O phosphotransferase